MKIMLLPLLLLASTCTISCTTQEKKVENAGEKVKEAKENVAEATENLNKAVLDSNTEYAKYKTATEATLFENEQRMAALKAKLQTDKKDMRVKYEKELDELYEKNTQMKTKINANKSITKDKWESFKIDFNNDLDKLGKSISALANKHQ